MIDSPKTHETFVIGFNKKSEIIFFKSYDYKNERDEAQADLKWVIDNCNGWYITSAHLWKMEKEGELFTININTP